MSEIDTHITSKVTREHVDRWACVYVRQSTMHQVEHHRESQANQYRLTERAKALGWADSRIRVIDRDLGKSGKDSSNREGFNDMLAEVSLGHVGIIFGYEVSRLARNNSDWYRLLDLAAVFGTLIADTDGVYDPRQYNDRLLLGLKGTMSEAELHLLRLRLQAGRISKVKSGRYRQCLPTGFVWTDANTVEQDPDEQVRHVMQFIFVTFEQIGSCHGVFRHLRREQILLPRRQAGTDLVAWKMASVTAISDILTNPAYAGAFGYGRTMMEPARKKAGSSAIPRSKRGPDEWVYMQRDANPGYISWDQYLRNQARIQTNGVAYMAKRQQASGAVREGHGLLQGLAVCGHCGRRMYTNHKPRPTYSCAQQQHEQHEMGCIVQGPAVDAAVVTAFFEALRPASLDALQQVLAKRQADQQRHEQHWLDQLRRVRYETVRAERQYHAVDPDNRLVASTLEHRWEEKLDQQLQAEEAYEKHVRSLDSMTLTPKLCEQFRHISETLPELWASDRISSAQKKELLRAIIANVILKRTATDRVEIKIIWVSGHYTVTQASLGVRRQVDLSNHDQMVTRLGELFRQGLRDAHIADVLSREGFRSARTSNVSASQVYKIRLANRWLCTKEQHRVAKMVDGAWTTRGLAEELGMSIGWIFNQIRRGRIPSDHVHRHADSGVYLIDDCPLVMNVLRAPLKA